jgi:hypothetical protein
MLVGRTLFIYKCAYVCYVCKREREREENVRSYSRLKRFYCRFLDKRGRKEEYEEEKEEIEV